MGKIKYFMCFNFLFSCVIRYQFTSSGGSKHQLQLPNLQVNTTQGWRIFQSKKTYLNSNQYILIACVDNKVLIYHHHYPYSLVSFYYISYSFDKTAIVFG